MKDRGLLICRPASTSDYYFCSPSLCLSGKRSVPPAVGGEVDEAASVKFLKPQHELSSMGLGEKEKEQIEGEGSEEALVLVGTGRRTTASPVPASRPHPHVGARAAALLQKVLR